MPFPAESALKLLDRARERGRLGHAYLVCGPKEAALEDFATQVLNMAGEERHADLEAWSKHGALIIRPESKSRRIAIEAVRTQVEPFLYVTTTGTAHRFVVFVDADRLTQQAQNAFLKTLEEPPPRTLMLLLSEHPDGLLETTLSRMIRVAVMPTGKKRALSDGESRLVAMLAGLAQRKDSASVSGALALRAEFESILEEIYARIEKQLEGDFDGEKKHLKQTTDVSSKWLENREDEMKAAVESRYLQERDGLMELLLSWMGDVLRHQSGVTRLDLPENAAHTQALAERWDGATVSRRIHELRKLHSNLHTNVQEGLALEAAFVAAFA
jgi:DNA polymerase-3 subunit delta'